MMINDIEVNGTTQKQYARMAKVTEATITRFINKKAILGFDSIISIVKHQFPDSEKKIMIDYILSQDNQNARIALEYSMMNQMPEIVDQIIEKLIGSEYAINKEWAKVYEIERMRTKKEISPQKLIEMAHKIGAKSNEMKIMIKFLVLYANYDQENFSYIQGLILGLEQQVDGINSGFIKSSFKLRLGQALSYISFYNNDIDTCRYYANMIIGNTDNPYYKATAYHTLAHSYLYESLEEGLLHLNNAFNYYEISMKEDHKKTIIRNMNFVKCFWNKEVSTCNLDLVNSNSIVDLEFHDIVDLAFHGIRNGKIEKAKELLDTINLSELTDWSKGFYYYYRALASDDNIDLYYNSVKYFRKSGDKFYLKLPLKELKRHGERESILKAFVD